MTGFNSKRDAAADKLQEHDPCPGCIRGGVCRTPKCGRLALPLDHPFRNLQPAQSEKEKISRQMTAEIAAARALAQPAQEPLSDDSIFDFANTYLYNGGKSYGILEFARAIEAAHGIKENT